MDNATVQQPLTTLLPNSNPTIVMLQVEAGFVSKHSVVPFCCPCPPFIAPLVAQTPKVSGQGLTSDSRHTCIWGKPGTRYLLFNLREIDHYDSGGVKIWARIKLDGRTHLHVFERGTLTAVRHGDEVLEPYLRHFTVAVDADFILIDGNVRLHRAHLIDKFLETDDIHRIDRSDFIPIDRIGTVW
ncbi:DDE_3 domain-containing protein [Trichonephila clavipes]|nr:DDE_3 domain-containing protein [Trichonephila clavipes]